MKKIFVIVFCISSIGCVTSKQAYLPDGSKGYSISCSGSGNTWGDCMEKAGELCGVAGYEIESKAINSESTIVMRKMFVKCS